ncbi:putative SERF-like protein [Cimex lectularius]|uniref:Small EDRK-rich factor-like N-terminal domain-containing protein n=1 Tax=Cimex lectularius TaxID=79782 RepID=A0A8I6RU82_CIMLE|nr:putative SERF-like protein [Cimex lectularius]XP_014251001.1 putative SERF-like protein [Cimex lectularius]XP_014251002.1 putative SERF-like protein [Cimex lectularius]XP_014251004.1 putative SERF-like protein [Cimex lectularius]
MARGNQRDLAREKNQKKQKELERRKGANEKGTNCGLSLEQRKQRDADAMREKQKKAMSSKGSDTN